MIGTLLRRPWNADGCEGKIGIWPKVGMSLVAVLPRGSNTEIQPVNHNPCWIPPIEAGGEMEMKAERMVLNRGRRTANGYGIVLTDFEI